jgi:hypothetical protein
VAKRNIWLGVAIAAVVVVLAIGYFFVAKRDAARAPVAPIGPNAPAALPSTPVAQPPDSDPTKAKLDANAPVSATETLADTKNNAPAPPVPAAPTSGSNTVVKPVDVPMPQNLAPQKPAAGTAIMATPQSMIQSEPSAVPPPPSGPRAPKPLPPKPVEPAPAPTFPPKAPPAAAEAKRSTQVTIPLPGRKSDR